MIIDEFDELALKSCMFLLFSKVSVDLDDLDSWTKLWSYAKSIDFAMRFFNVFVDLDDLGKIGRFVNPNVPGRARCGPRRS